MKINIKEINIDYEIIDWSDLLLKIDQNRSEDLNLIDKKYIVFGRKNKNDTSMTLMLLKKNEINRNHQRLSCCEIADISSQILKEEIKNNTDVTNDGESNINLENREQETTAIEKIAQSYHFTKSIVERSNAIRDKKINCLNVGLIIKVVLVISIVGIPIILYLNWAIERLKNQKDSLKDKIFKLEIYHTTINNKINLLKSEINQLKKESEEKKQIAELENKKIEEENKRIDESVVKITKNLNLNEKIFRTNVKEKGLENTEEFYLHQLKEQIEGMDQKVDVIFWNNIDKLIDEKNSLTDRVNLYKSILILSSKKSIISFAEALKNEKNIVETKEKLREVLLKTSKEFEKRILNQNIKKRTSEFFTGSYDNYGFLIDDNQDVHIVREMFAKGGEKNIHVVTSLNSSEEYIAGISHDEYSIEREQAFLEYYKDKPGIPPAYKVIVKYKDGTKSKCVYLQKRFLGDGRILFDLKPIYQLKAFIGAIQGLCILHKDKIAHCDFKIANFLIDYKLNGYITDFGACTPVGAIQEIYTSNYAAPKVIADMEKGKDHKITGLYEDSYSVGITLLQFIDITLLEEGQTPINELSDNELKLLLQNTRKKIEIDNSLSVEDKKIKLEELKLVKKLLVKPINILFLKIKKGMTCEEALKELLVLYSKYEHLIQN